MTASTLASVSRMTTLKSLPGGDRVDVRETRLVAEAVGQPVVQAADEVRVVGSAVETKTRIGTLPSATLLDGPVAITPP